MNSPDIKINSRRLTRTKITSILKKNAKPFPLTTTKRLSAYKLELQLNNRKILKLESLLYTLTLPDNIQFSDDDQTWLFQIIEIKKQLYELQKPINNTPKTVGEYFQQILKNK